MNESGDRFEHRLAEQLFELSETPLPGPAVEVVASTAMAKERPMRWRAGLLALAAAVAAIATTAVLARRPADLGPQSSGPQSSGASPSTELTYTCGGHTFSAALFNDPEADLRSLPAGVALAEFIESGHDGGPQLPPGGWRLAGIDDSSASFVVALPSDPPYAHAEAEKDASQWRIVSWGECRPALEMRHMNPATWNLVPESIDAETTTFLAEVTENACASGQPSENRVVPPLIIYQPERVIVTFSVEPLPGSQECPDNPSTRVRVRLSEPLGDRQLLDGGTLPWRDPRADG